MNHQSTDPLFGGVEEGGGDLVGGEGVPLPFSLSLGGGLAEEERVSLSLSGDLVGGEGVPLPASLFELERDDGVGDTLDSVEWSKEQLGLEEKYREK